MQSLRAEHAAPIFEDFKQWPDKEQFLPKLDRLKRYVGDWQRLIDEHFGEGQGNELFSLGDGVDTLRWCGFHGQASLLNWSFSKEVQNATEEGESQTKDSAYFYGRVQTRSSSDGP